MTPALPEKITIVDLFAGCGGLTQGFREFVPAGRTESPFRTLGAVEIDEAAATTYAANFASEAGGSEHVFNTGIEDWNPGDLRDDVDVILGGPPCQGFSALGKQDPDDPRNQLWREYIRVVGKLQPKVFVIENVDRFLKSPEYAELESAVAEKGALENYVLERKHLVAADYGVPQARKRTIVLATRRDVMDLHPQKSPLQHPEPTHAKNPEPDLWESIKPWETVQNIFGTPHAPKSLVKPEGTELPPGRINLLGKDMPGPFRTDQLHIGRKPIKLSLDRYEKIPPGGNRHDIPPHLSTESWLNHRSGTGDVMGRLHLDRPSVTIRTEFYKPEKGRYLHPWAHRPITHYEAALFQGFPEDFLWCGSKTQIARQIGNAVPVGLARAIAQQVHAYLMITRSS
ncbi:MULTISPECIES: DNA cytosine methyltransferase [Nocardiopsidaceae]|uniref:Cytosine-specific methyltransferase n=2 Tax=Nocardiopsidaceae TaxID=83676 RepID=A0ABY6YHZ1_9ACTN|nr:DNA cytosine methyltransferase [Streptomonospora nanhaiensis]WAE71895.1 DNA cytosine methyltransferase [Streptomonospora nanhaiensis]